MSRKAFLEITNVCNLSCSFCHKTKRPPRFITEEEFYIAAEKLRPFADFLYFHLMGEPLLHPNIERFFEIADELGFKVIITTNGTLLREKGDILLNAHALHKVSISLHSYEVNSISMSMDEYLETCFDFSKKLAEKDKFAVMRLWNKGGFDTLNEEILRKMHESFQGDWEERYSGYRLAHKVFLEWGELFEWPDEGAEDFGANHSCYGLRDQVGVLCDGTVVPCCLDSDGVISLGNIFESSIEEILETPRAKALKKSFETRSVTENLCRRCGYAAMKRK